MGIGGIGIWQLLIILLIVVMLFGTKRLRTLGSDLVVSLASDDTSELDVPGTVTILAGQTSATFDLTVVDDSDYDGAQTATVTASASGLTDATGPVIVRDDDVDHFSFDTIATPQTAGEPFAVRIEAQDVNGAVIVPFAESLDLSGSNALAKSEASLLNRARTRASRSSCPSARAGGAGRAISRNLDS